MNATNVTRRNPMGPFGENAEGFIDHNLAVFPTNGAKGQTPCIKGWNKIGLKGSRALLSKGSFDHDNIGIVCGERAGLTIVDIDTPGERALTDALSHFGDSPVVIRTGSGKHHVYYKHNGERRQIKPFKNDEKLAGVDILGTGGYVIAPPSVRPDYGGASYEFITGRLDDLGNLPAIKGLTPAMELHTDGLGVGSRVDDLFGELRNIAHQCDDIDALAHRARGINETKYNPPLSDTEVMSQVKGVWKLKSEGRCFSKAAQIGTMPRSEAIVLFSSPSALSLLVYLRGCHGIDHTFAVSPKGLSCVLGVGHATIARARDCLLSKGYLALVEKGKRKRGRDGKVKNEPNIYRLTGVSNRGTIEHTASPL